MHVQMCACRQPSVKGHSRGTAAVADFGGVKFDILIAFLKFSPLFLIALLDLTCVSRSVTMHCTSLILFLLKPDKAAKTLMRVCVCVCVCGDAEFTGRILPRTNVHTPAHHIIPRINADTHKPNTGTDSRTDLSRTLTCIHTIPYTDEGISTRKHTQTRTHTHNPTHRLRHTLIHTTPNTDTDSHAIVRTQLTHRRRLSSPPHTQTHTFCFTRSTASTHTLTPLASHAQ
jgi:hypothetical protein